MAETAWTPPVSNCSRCGLPMPDAPDGWTWRHRDEELVCPDCETSEDRDNLLGCLELTDEDGGDA